MYWLRDCLQTSLHLVCVDNQNSFKYVGFQHYIIKDMYTERMKHGFENYSEMSQKSELYIHSIYDGILVQDISFAMHVFVIFARREQGNGRLPSKDHYDDVQ